MADVSATGEVVSHSLFSNFGIRYPIVRGAELRFMVNRRRISPGAAWLPRLFSVRCLSGARKMLKLMERRCRDTRTEEDRP